MIMCLVIDEWTTKLIDTPSKTSRQPHLFPKIKKTSPMTKTKKLQNQLTWTWLPLRPMSSWHALSVSVHSNASKPHPSVAHIERKHAHNVLQLSKELHIPNLSILLSHFILKQQQLLWYEGTPIHFPGHMIPSTWHPCNPAQSLSHLCHKSRLMTPRITTMWSPPPPFPYQGISPRLAITLA